MIRVSQENEIRKKKKTEQENKERREEIEL